MKNDPSPVIAYTSLSGSARATPSAPLISWPIHEVPYSMLYESLVSVSHNRSKSPGKDPAAATTIASGADSWRKICKALHCDSPPPVTLIKSAICFSGLPQDISGENEGVPYSIVFTRFISADHAALALLISSVYELL